MLRLTLEGKNVENSNMSRSLILIKIELSEYFINKKTHKLFALIFWVKV